MAQLKVVQQKFVESKAAVSDITPAIKGIIYNLFLFIIIIMYF